MFIDLPAGYFRRLIHLENGASGEGSVFPRGLDLRISQCHPRALLIRDFSGLRENRAKVSLLLGPPPPPQSQVPRPGEQGKESSAQNHTPESYGQLPPCAPRHPPPILIQTQIHCSFHEPRASPPGPQCLPARAEIWLRISGSRKGKDPPAQSYQIGNRTQAKAQRTKLRGPDFTNCRRTRGAARERLKQGQGLCTPTPTGSWILGVAPELCALHTTGDPADCAWSGSLRDPVETAPRS